MIEVTVWITLLYIDKVMILSTEMALIRQAFLQRRSQRLNRQDFRVWGTARGALTHPG